MEAEKLLGNFRVMKMKSWEIVKALKYPFVRECLGLAISFAEKLSSTPGNNIEPFILKTIRRDELERKTMFTLMFKITILKNISGKWKFRGAIHSPWETDKATGRKWRLKIDENTRNCIFISLYLCLDHLRDSIKVDEYEIFIMKNTNSGAIPYYLKSTQCTVVPGRLYGFRKFIRKVRLIKEGSEFITNSESLRFGANIYQGIDSSPPSASLSKDLIKLEQLRSD